MSLLQQDENMVTRTNALQQDLMHSCKDASKAAKITLCNLTAQEGKQVVLDASQVRMQSMGVDNGAKGLDEVA